MSYDNRKIVVTQERIDELKKHIELELKRAALRKALPEVMALLIAE